MIKILIVEDDRNIRKGLIDNFQMEGYDVMYAEDGQQGLELAESEKPNLIILDITLPKLNGFEVCKELKARGILTPIIILSSRSDEVDKILGLEMGADDYVTKPFSPRELMVRVKAVLRRVTGTGQDQTPETYTFGEITVDFKKYQVKRGQAPFFIKLTAAEFTILKILITNAGQPVSRHTILGEIWSEDVTTRTVDTHIWKLREKLEEDPSHPRHIITVHRIGYKFV